MAARKINAQDVFLARILGQRSAAVRKSAADTIRVAEQHLLRSEEIVSQSMAIVEKAEEILSQSGRIRRKEYDRQNSLDRLTAGAEKT